MFYLYEEVYIKKSRIRKVTIIGMEWNKDVFEKEGMFVCISFSRFRRHHPFGRFVLNMKR